MDITPLIKEGQQIIQSYASGRFKVSGKAYDHPIIVYPDRTEGWIGIQNFENLTKQSFGQMIKQSDHIDVVLLGTGNAPQFLSAMLRHDLRAEGLIVDVMDTGAACRTYNVLMAEGRRVAAALFPFE